MSQQRVLRINELIKEEMGKILLRELDLEKGILVTVTRVSTSPNLYNANVFVSVYPQEHEKKVVQGLRGQIYELQQFLNKRLRMRPVPKIAFVEETLVREAGDVEKRLAEINTTQGESEV